MIEVHTLSLGACAMRYARFGRGKRQVLLLPGLTVQPVTPMAAATAAPYRDYFDDFTFTLLDRRENVPEGYTLTDMAEDTAGAITALGLSPCAVVGTSQGGMLALALAGRHPALVSRLVLCSTSMKTDDCSSPLLRRWRALAEAGEREELAFSFLRQMFSAAYLAPLEKGIPLLARRYTEGELCRFARLCGTIEAVDLTEETRAVTCPALVLHGEADKVFPASSAAALARALGAEYYCYPAPCGHAVSTEATDFSRRVCEFLFRNMP